MEITYIIHSKKENCILLKIALHFIIFHHFYSIRNHSHSIRNHSHSLVKSHRYHLSMFVEDINSFFEKMWNESHFFLNLNYNDNIKWIWWISFLIKYNFKIIYWRYTNVDLLFNIISRLKYVFISYQIFINTSCKNIVAYTWSFLTYFSELKKFFTHQLIDMMIFIQRQTDCCI